MVSTITELPTICGSSAGALPATARPKRRPGVMFDVPAEEVARDGQRAGLRLARLDEEGADRLGRAEVWWQTVALRKGEE